jgi:hypothetical protein
MALIAGRLRWKNRGESALTSSIYIITLRCVNFKHYAIFKIYRN